MKIELREVTIRELVEGYVDNGEGGVSGYRGRLDIRPAYQREFIYKEKERNAVIQSVTQGFPLNVMYWASREDGTFEVMDGQQRTISICQYATNVFSLDGLYYNNLTDDKQAAFLDYKLMVYVCSGSDSEKLAWFQTINIAGKTLSAQELRNAVYAGQWVTDAKRYLSRSGCPGMKLGKDYLSGDAIRQDYFETAIEWYKDPQVSIEEFMAQHQHDANALALWNHFRSVLNWVEGVFPKKRSQMKSVKWGDLYRTYHTRVWDATALEARIATLMADDDVTSKSGIYPYVLSGDEHLLSIRAFTPSQKTAAYERQKGKCCLCKKHFELEQMEGDHITPWSQGGKTIPENCQMLCRDCNRRKSNK